MENLNAKKAFEAFGHSAENTTIAPYGEGHINTTYKVDSPDGVFILQKVNTNVFPAVKEMMQNVSSVTAFLRKKIESRGGDGDRETMNFYKTTDGNWLYEDADGGMWRLCRFVNDSVCLQSPRCEEDFLQSGVAFGQFLCDLADFPAETLYEVIARFHDTPNRFEAFEKALAENLSGRRDTCKEEIDFLLSQKDFTRTLKDANLPLRVTHNDTKLNNVLLSEDYKALCVIDLDTIMPGYAVTDFGDSIRFGASTAKEDEKDLSKVNLSLDRFKAYAKGYIGQCKNALTKKEIDLMPEGAMMMTIECGMRFLTDYLNGDTYFRTAYPEHNLVRARTQLKLYKEMQKNLDEMHKIIDEIVKEG